MYMGNLEFSHTEKCFSTGGWMFLKSWYIDHDQNGKLIFFVEDVF